MTVTEERGFTDDPEQLKVLDLGVMLGGPFVATILGDLGAEVIKVEKPGVGDPMRYQGSGREQMSYRWQVDGRNKRSVTIDLRKPAGQDLLRRLAQWADILVENMRPGTLARYGLGYEDLQTIAPRLVYVSVSGFGQTGPNRKLPGYDFVGAAYGGLTYSTGFADRPPVVPGLPVVDFCAAMFATIGALEAVRRRDIPQGSGRGEWVDVGLYEPMLRMAGQSIARYVAEGTIHEREGGMPITEKGTENAYAWSYKTADGHYISFFTVTDEQFGRLVKLLGDPPELDSNWTLRERVDHAFAIDREMRAWALAHPRDEAIALLGNADVPTSPINSVADIWRDPHILERGSVIQAMNHFGETVTMQGVVPRLVEHPAPLRWLGEPLGASNRDVLQGLLKLTDAAYDDLAAGGVI
jgi:formyl-CoA transferase